MTRQGKWLRGPECGAHGQFLFERRGGAGRGVAGSPARPCRGRAIGSLSSLTCRERQRG